MLHTCPRCFQNKRDKLTAYNRTHEAYESTRAKIDKIKSLGYEIREIWECTFDRRKIENLRIANYVNNHPLISKMVLNQRDAFFGGRTENIAVHYKIREGEKIRYTDICSFYPYICKRGWFLLGHPDIFVGSQCDALTEGNNNHLSRVEGLIKCKILPPRNLFLPLLPIKMYGRLLFVALAARRCDKKIVLTNILTSANSRGRG